MGRGIHINFELVPLSMGQAGRGGGGSQFPRLGVPQREDMKHVNLGELGIFPRPRAYMEGESSEFLYISDIIHPHISEYFPHITSYFPYLFSYFTHISQVL